MSGELKFFQGQGIVREFYDLSGKNEILSKCQGNIREFYISVMLKLRCLVLMYLSCLIHESSDSDIVREL